MSLPIEIFFVWFTFTAIFLGISETLFNAITQTDCELKNMSNVQGVCNLSCDMISMVFEELGEQI